MQADPSLCCTLRVTLSLGARLGLQRLEQAIHRHTLKGLRIARQLLRLFSTNSKAHQEIGTLGHGLSAPASLQIQPAHRLNAGQGSPGCVRCLDRWLECARNPVFVELLLGLHGGGVAVCHEWLPALVATCSTSCLPDHLCARQVVHIPVWPGDLHHVQAGLCLLLLAVCAHGVGVLCCLLGLCLSTLERCLCTNVARHRHGLPGLRVEGHAVVHGGHVLQLAVALVVLAGVHGYAGLRQLPEICEVLAAQRLEGCNLVHRGTTKPASACWLLRATSTCRAAQSIAKDAAQHVLLLLKRLLLALRLLLLQLHFGLLHEAIFLACLRLAHGRQAQQAATPKRLHATATACHCTQTTRQNALRHRAVEHFKDSCHLQSPLLACHLLLQQALCTSCVVGLPLRAQQAGEISLPCRNACRWGCGCLWVVKDAHLAGQPCDGRGGLQVVFVEDACQPTALCRAWRELHAVADGCSDTLTCVACGQNSSLRRCTWGKAVKPGAACSLCASGQARASSPATQATSQSTQCSTCYCALQRVFIRQKACSRAKRHR